MLRSLLTLLASSLTILRWTFCSHPYCIFQVFDFATFYFHFCSLVQDALCMQNPPVLPVCIYYSDTRLGLMRKHSVTLSLGQAPCTMRSCCFASKDPLALLVITVPLFLFRLPSFLTFGFVSSLQLPFSQRAFFLLVTSNSLWNEHMANTESSGPTGTQFQGFSLCFQKNTLSLWCDLGLWCCESRLWPLTL